MAEGYEVAKAWITIVPTLNGAQETISKELGASTEPAAKQAGEKAGKNFGESLAKGLKVTGAAIGAAMTAVTGAAVATGKAFINTANDISSMGDSIGDNAAKMGISTKAYQEWDFILQRSGSSIDAMKTSMKTLANAAVNGSDAFKTLGISQKELNSLSQEELFERTVKALSGIEDTSKRTALASKLLGKGALELGGVFNMTSDEIEQAKQKMYDLGAYMDEDAIAASDTYQDTMTDLQDSIKGMKMRVISDFLPGITSVMDGLSKVFSGKGGVGEIQDGLKSIIDNIAALAPKLLPIAQTLISSLISGFAPMLPSLVSAIFDIVVQTITTVTSMIPQMMPSIITGIKGIMSAVMSAMPIIIQGMTTLILELANWLSSGGAEDLIDGLIAMTVTICNNIAVILPPLLKALVTVISEIAKALTKPSNLEMLLDAVITVVGAIAVAIWDSLPVIWDMIKGVIGNLGNLVGDFLYWIVPKVAEGLSKVINTVKGWGENIKGFFVGLWNTLKDGVAKNLDNLKSKFTSIFDNVRNVVKTAIDKIKSFFHFSWSLPKLKMPHFSITGKFSLDPPSIPKIGVSWYAKAMDEPFVLNNATIFGAMNGNLLGGGERGSEVVVGTRKLMDMIADAKGGNQNVVINVYAAEGQNVNDLAEKIAYKLEDMTRRKAVANGTI